MPNWIKNSPSDVRATQRAAFISLVSAIPVVRGWFGISARRIKLRGDGSLQATSVVSSIFLALAKGLGDWTQAVTETTQSIFLAPPIPKGNRWIEHIRNSYRDYGIDLTPLDFNRGSTESTIDYERRLEFYAMDLVNLFRSQSVTLQAIKDGLLKILPLGATVDIVEPWTQIRRWPGPKGYQIERLPNETDGAYNTRVNVYMDLYDTLKNRALSHIVSDSKGKQTVQKWDGSRPNTLYPLPAGAAVNTPDLDEGSLSDPASVVSRRLALLKSRLGSYTNLDVTTAKRYPSERTQGGRIEIVLNTDLNDAFYILAGGGPKKYPGLKAVGVQVTVTVKQYLGTAASTAKQSPDIADVYLERSKDELVASNSAGPIIFAST